jgi:hypothetical protein
VTADPGEGAPASYATRDEARAYMARVLARPAPATPGEVYLIARPGRPAARSIAKLLPTLAAMLPGAELVGHADVFGRGAAVEVPERVERLAARVRGAVVIPRWLPAQEAWVIGPSARAEAVGLVAAGVPVLVLTPRGLVAWPDVRAREVPEYPQHARWALDLPAPARWRELPTVAASLRAIGVRPPRPGARRRPGPARGAPTPRARRRA